MQSRTIIERLTRKLKGLPNDSEDYNKRGIVHDKQGRYDEALQDFDEAIRLKPNFADAYYYRGRLHHDQGRYEAALQDFNEAIRLAPDAPVIYLKRANVHHDQGRYDEALRDYDEAIRLKPDYASAYNNRGFIHMNQGRYDEALRDYDEAIRLKPDYASYYNRGLLHKDQGRYDEALQDYDEAIRLKPDCAQAYCNRAVIHKWQGHYAEALQDFNETIRLKPDYAEAYTNRGHTLIFLDQLAEARQDIENGIELRPEKLCYSSYAKGFLSYCLGDYLKACSEYNEAIRLLEEEEPIEIRHHPEFYYHRALVHEELGQYNEVLEDLDEALRLFSLGAPSRPYCQWIDVSSSRTHLLQKQDTHILQKKENKVTHDSINSQRNSKNSSSDDNFFENMHKDEKTISQSEKKLTSISIPVMDTPKKSDTKQTEALSNKAEEKRKYNSNDLKRIKDSQENPLSNISAKNDLLMLTSSDSKSSVSLTGSDKKVSLSRDEIRRLHRLVGQPSSSQNLSLSAQQQDTLVDLLSRSETLVTQENLDELYTMLSDEEQCVANKEEAFLLQRPALHDYYQIASFLLVRTHHVFLSIDDGRFEQGATSSTLPSVIGQGLDATLKSLPGISAVTAIVEYIVGEVLSKAEGRFYVRKLLSLALLPSDMERLARQFARQMAIRLRKDIPQNLPNKKRWGFKERCKRLWQTVKQDLVTSSIGESAAMDSNNHSHQQAFEDVTEMLLALFSISLEDIKIHCVGKPLSDVVGFLVDLAMTERRRRKGDQHVHDLGLLDETSLDEGNEHLEEETTGSLIKPAMFFSPTPLHSSSTESKEDQEKLYRLEEQFDLLQLRVQDLTQESTSSESVDRVMFEQMQQTMSQLCNEMNKIKKELNTIDAGNQGLSGGSMMLMQRRPEEKQPTFMLNHVQQVKEVGDLQDRADDHAQLIAFLQEEMENIQSTLENLEQSNQLPSNRSPVMSDNVFVHLQESLDTFIVKIDRMKGVLSENWLSPRLFNKRTTDKQEVLDALKDLLASPATLNLGKIDAIETGFQHLFVTHGFHKEHELLQLFEQVKHFVISNHTSLSQMPASPTLGGHS